MTMRCRQRGLWNLMLLLLSVRPLAAQTNPPLPTVAPLRAGPVSLYPAINLHDIGIDSNIFNDSAVPKEDFTFSVTPRLQAAWPIGGTRLVGTASSDFVFYQTYKDQQSINSALDGRFDVVSGRLRPFVSAGQLRTKERSGFEIDARALRVETNVVAGLDFELSTITALTAWARRDDLSYGQGQRYLGASLSAELDHTGQLAAAGVKLAVTPLTTIIIAAEVQQDRFSSSPFRDADSVRVAPSVEFSTAAAITGHASAGYRQFKPLDARLPEYRGFVASAGLAYTLFGVTQFNVQANRDVTYSFDASQPYYLAFGGGVIISQRLVGPLDLIVLGNRERLRYQALEGPVLEGRVETTTSGGGGLGVRVGDHLRLTLTYDRTKRESSGPSNRAYERRRLLGSVNYGL